MSERGQEELRELANKYNAAVNEIKELTDKIKVHSNYYCYYYYNGFICYWFTLCLPHSFPGFNIYKQLQNNTNWELHCTAAKFVIVLFMFFAFMLGLLSAHCVPSV